VFRKCLSNFGSGFGLIRPRSRTHSGETWQLVWKVSHLEKKKPGNISVQGVEVYASVEHPFQTHFDHEDWSCDKNIRVQKHKAMNFTLCET
jgi:hypothetical protein